MAKARRRKKAKESAFDQPQLDWGLGESTMKVEGSFGKPKTRPVKKRSKKRKRTSVQRLLHRLI